MPVYDKRNVPCHGSNKSTVFLMNEAPGPNEAHYGIPSIGSQGGSIYRALRRAGICWAVGFENGEYFPWPTKILEKYSEPESRLPVFQKRDRFLKLRSDYITCSNAYPRWPKRSQDSTDFVAPDSADVLSNDNIERVINEIHDNHKVLLICGMFAWLLCMGAPIENPAQYEGNPIQAEDLKRINERLCSGFQHAWYMGHTRRWSLDCKRTNRLLRQISDVAGW